MYTDFFGLNEKPFSITPDPRYLFMSEQHVDALAYLVYGVTESGGFIQLTGEVGTGKTTICRCLLEQLPEALGTDVVLLTSDLHYLQVRTRLGRAMILGALREVEAAFGDAGIRVHRSHWVLLDAVTRLRQSGNGWLVELVDGHKLPVSRRKRREVSERLGRDFVREDVGGASG